MRVHVLKIIFCIWKARVTNFTFKSYHISLTFSFLWFVSSIQVCTQAPPSFKGTRTVQMNTRQKMSTTKMSMFQSIVFKKSPLRWCHQCAELTLPFHTRLPYCGLNGVHQWLTGWRLCCEALFSPWWSGFKCGLLPFAARPPSIFLLYTCIPVAPTLILSHRDNIFKTRSK